MAESTSPAYRTLSWLRQGLSAGGGAAAATGPFTLTMQLTVNGTRDVTMPMQLSGPAEVTGIDSREVIRTDPHPGAGDFEPNYFPLIEFDRPDFPWLFTPTAADADHRLRPWICLVVVRKESASLTSAADRPLPVLECPLRELPDLRDSWAWAHAEVVAGNGAALDPATLKQVLKQKPERTLSRLLCPRRLDPNTRYLACLVPTYEAGRLTGLGESVTTEQENARLLAWPTDPPERPVRLPVYFHWEFGTAADGDFEALARRLTPQQLPSTVGQRPMDVSNPGWGMPKLAVGAPGAVLDLGGALQTPETAPRPWPEEARKAFQQALRNILDTSTQTDSASTPPAVLAPPLYGQGYTDVQSAPTAEGLPHWFAELNLDPRYRVAAGMGALVIRYEQEHLMASAWDQLARQERDHQRLKRVQLAETVGAGLRDKHLGSSEGQGSSSAVVALAALREKQAPGSEDPTSSAAYRRLTRSRGPLAKRMERFGGSRAVGSSRASLQALAAPIPTQETPATDLLRFAPEFSQPMYELLRDYFEDALLPGMELVPANTVALLETNRKFIEAYLAGLNHEMSRELLWRGFPADHKGSYFRRFWGLRDDGGGRREDIANLREWSAASGLGEHGAAKQDEIVLLIRGELLRRYPRAVVYAVEAVWSEDKKRRELGSTEQYPMFRASQPPDVTLLGFGLTEAQVRGADDQASGHPGWFFVLQEQPTEPRFGLDVAKTYGGAPQRWSDLSWGHMAADAAALRQITHISIAGTLKDLVLDGLPWGKNSAQMAGITRQRPFRVAIHARTWLPAIPKENQS